MLLCIHLQRLPHPPWRCAVLPISCYPFLHADDELLQQYGMSVTLAVCEAYEVQRIKEELALLPREMDAHLQYWQAVVDKQDRLIAVLLTPPPATAGDVEAAVQQLHAVGFKVSMFVLSCNACKCATSWDRTCGQRSCMVSVNSDHNLLVWVGQHVSVD